MEKDARDAATVLSFALNIFSASLPRQITKDTMLFVWMIVIAAPGVIYAAWSARTSLLVSFLQKRRLRGKGGNRV